MVHKEPGMINVFSPKCASCFKTPSFNYIGLPPKYCASHKLENMENVKSKKCKYQGCMIVPSYNFDSFRTAQYCVNHKQPGMVYITKVCYYPGCRVIPSYNYVDKKTPVACSAHKKENMDYVKLEYRSKRKFDEIDDAEN